MEDLNGEFTDNSVPGIAKMDSSWMTTFWEVFCDAIIEMDAHHIITNVLRKTDSTFDMADIIGRSFLDIAVDKDREFAAKELELLKTTDAPYRRFTFLSKIGRYYRWTLAPLRSNGVFTGIHGMGVDATEQSLKEITLNWQRAIIEGSSDFISIAGMDGHVLYTNPGAYRMTGYDSSLPALPLERIFNPEHLEAVRGEGLEKALLDGYWTGLSELVCTDGTKIPIEHNMFSVRNEQDETILIATIIRNITEFVEHEKTMKSEQRRTELLASIAMSFSLSDDYDATINEALASIGSYMGVNAMYIYRDIPEQSRFVCDYLWLSDPSFDVPMLRERQYHDAETNTLDPEYTMLQNVQIFVSDNISELDDDSFTEARGAGIKSLVYLPVHVDDKFWGFIGLVMYTAARTWSEGDIQFLKTVCGILSTSLEKRLMSQRWQAAQSDLQAVVRNYPGIIWSLNSSRCFTLYDGAFLGVSGEKASDMVGRNMHEYAGKHPGLLHPSMLEMVEKTFMGEPQDWMMELKHAVFRCNTMPIQDAQGNITGVVGASVDVTGMIQMQKDLEEARVAAEAANVAKSEFLSRMSHEIRTPMNAIIGMTQIAQGSADEERIRNCLGKIAGASRHLLALINDVLDISKIEANKLELQNDLFDLGRCFENIRSIIAVKIEEKKLKFELRLDESLPPCVEGDELRFTQIIINLLGNAIKFTPENGMVTLEAGQRGREGGECVIEVCVRDSGIGITPEHQEKLFMPFEQADGSITREYGGSGLGLAICKYIVTLMGGSIRVESAPGKGSMFAFTVRMRIGDGEAYRKLSMSKSHPQTNTDKGAALVGVDDLSRFTVLLVEDVEINREIVYTILEHTHINMEHAENGAQAVEMFAANPDKYDLILMDMQMPVMDGLEATRRIRAMDNDASKRVAIVAMTANVFREDVDKCIAAGMNDHLMKPIDSNLLHEKLIHYLFMSGYLRRR